AGRSSMVLPATNRSPLGAGFPPREEAPAPPPLSKMLALVSDRADGAPGRRRLKPRGRFRFATDRNPVPSPPVLAASPEALFRRDPQAQALTASPKSGAP